MQIGGDPHHVLYDNPYVFTVNEKAQRVDAGLSEFVSVDRIALYHYALKSQASLNRFETCWALCRSSDSAVHRPLTSTVCQCWNLRQPP